MLWGDFWGDMRMAKVDMLGKGVYLLQSKSDSTQFLKFTKCIRRGKVPQI